MTIAMRPVPARIPGRIPSSPVAAISGTHPITHTEIFDRFSAAEPHWRALERGHALATPYQDFDFLAPWQRHVGAQSGIEPFIVVGFDAAGAPLMLLPFGSRRLGGLRVIEFLGGKHANFNFPLCRRDFVLNAAKGDIEAMVAQFTGRADVMLLTNQPVAWQGIRNPFGLLSQQPSPSFSYSGALTLDFDALLRERSNAATRKKMRKKAESLARFGAVKFARAETPDQIRRVLDVFFAQKQARMQTRGVANVFDELPVHQWLDAAVNVTTASGRPVIELYSLSVEDTIVATMGGIVGGGRFCGMFNSIEVDRFAAESPGEQLIVQLVRNCCERGLTVFDLGTGEARYKNLLCGDAEPMFDSFIGLTPAGHMIAFGARWRAAAKRLVKQNPALWSLIETARRLPHRLALA